MGIILLLLKLKLEVQFSFASAWALNISRKMYFKLSIFLIAKVISFYAIICLYANYTIIEIKKRLVDAFDLLVQKNYKR